MAANHSCPATIWKILAWCLLVLVLAPALTFGLTASVSWSALWQQIWNDPVIHGSLRRSLTVLGWTWGIGFAMGWPLGTALTLARSRVRILAWTWLAPGLLCPPFLWAAGLQGWKAWLPYTLQPWLDGRSGLVLSLGLQNVVMVAVLTGGGTGGLSFDSRPQTAGAYGPPPVSSGGFSFESRVEPAPARRCGGTPTDGAPHLCQRGAYRLCFCPT
jgi:ABC-type Fe3+ transport system permease subunit